MVGDTGVDFCCLAAGVAQELLDVSQVDALFEQMGGKAVSQGMGGGMFGNVGFFQCPAKDILNACGAIWFAPGAFK